MSSFRSSGTAAFAAGPIRPSEPGGHVALVLGGAAIQVRLLQRSHQEGNHALVLLHSPQHLGRGDADLVRAVGEPALGLLLARAITRELPEREGRVDARERIGVIQLLLERGNHCVLVGRLDEPERLARGRLHESRLIALQERNECRCGIRRGRADAPQRLGRG